MSRDHRWLTLALGCCWGGSFARVHNGDDDIEGVLVQ